MSDPPTGRADLHPYLAAKLGQFWVIRGGRRVGSATAAGIDGPEPVVFTPTLTAAIGADAVRHCTVVPTPGTWINQQQLLIGQRNDLFRPLVLEAQNSCFQRWKQAGHGSVSCP